jgi:FAD synthase
VVNCQWSVVSVDVVERLRDVKKFENKEALKEQIADDIKKTHSLLEY